MEVSIIQPHAESCIFMNRTIESDDGPTMLWNYGKRWIWIVLVCDSLNRPFAEMRNGKVPIELIADEMLSQTSRLNDQLQWFHSNDHDVSRASTVQLSAAKVRSHNSTKNALNSFPWINSVNNNKIISRNRSTWPIIMSPPLRTTAPLRLVRGISLCVGQSEMHSYIHHFTFGCNASDLTNMRFVCCGES